MLRTAVLAVGVLMLAAGIIVAGLSLPGALWLLIALILLPAWITLRRTLNGNPRC